MMNAKNLANELKEYWEALGNDKPLKTFLLRLWLLSFIVLVVIVPAASLCLPTPYFWVKPLCVICCWTIFVCLLLLPFSWYLKAKKDKDKKTAALMERGQRIGYLTMAMAQAKGLRLEQFPGIDTCARSVLSSAGFNLTANGDSVLPPDFWSVDSDLVAQILLTTIVAMKKTTDRRTFVPPEFSTEMVEGLCRLCSQSPAKALYIAILATLEGGDTFARQIKDHLREKICPPVI